MASLGALHHTIIRYIIDNGYAPVIPTLANILQEEIPDIERLLYDLEEYHGVVLHPHEPKIWVIHPFSLAPTNFLVTSSNKQWWGNCAWCSLGIAALLKEDVTITTTLGGHDEQAVIHIRNGKVEESPLFIHFPIPMKNAWDNVIYTCSNMLVFRDEDQVDQWTKQHNIPKGDIQPVTTIWEFAQRWYGNHLNPHWEKWTMQEAKEIFAEFNLTHRIWDIESLSSRF